MRRRGIPDALGAPGPRAAVSAAGGEAGGGGRLSARAGGGGDGPGAGRPPRAAGALRAGYHHQLQRDRHDGGHPALHAILPPAERKDALPRAAPLRRGHGAGDAAIQRRDPPGSAGAPGHGADAGDRRLLHGPDLGALSAGKPLRRDQAGRRPGPGPRQPAELPGDHLVHRPARGLPEPDRRGGVRRDKGAARDPARDRLRLLSGVFVLPRGVFGELTLDAPIGEMS